MAIITRLFLLFLISISITPLTADDAPKQHNGHHGPHAPHHGHQGHHTKNETTNPHIQEVCSQTPSVDFCVETLTADHSSHKADAHHLAKKIFQMVEGGAHNTSFFLSGLIKTGGGGGDQAFEKCITVCADNYKDATGKLHEMKTAIEKKSFDEAKTKLSAAMTDASTCKKSCNGVAQASELITRTDNFNTLCSIAQSLTGLLSK